MKCFRSSSSSKRRDPRRSRGLSLVEMLVVLSILGIMSFIMVPHMKTEEVKNSRDRRNAQTLAAVCLSAQTAGKDFVVAGDVEATVRAIVAGGTPADGTMQTSWFGVPGLDDFQILGAVPFLTLENGMLVYDSGY